MGFHDALALVSHRVVLFAALVETGIGQDPGSDVAHCWMPIEVIGLDHSAKG